MIPTLRGNCCCCCDPRARAGPGDEQPNGQPPPGIPAQDEDENQRVIVYQYSIPKVFAEAEWMDHSLRIARENLRVRGEFYKTLQVGHLFRWIIYDEKKTRIIERN